MSKVLACQHCRKAKVKCIYNTLASSCTKCTAKNIDCVLIPPRKRGPKPSTPADYDQHISIASDQLNIPSNILHMLVTGLSINPLIKQLPILHLHSLLADFQ